MSELIKSLVNKKSKEFKRYFKTVYEDFYSDIYRFAYMKISDSDLANDFTQEAFGKLWTNRESIDFSLNIKSYLFKTVQNITIDHLRKKSTQSEIKTDYTEFDVKSEESNTDLQEQVLEVISSCPKNHQEAFVLNKIEGYKYYEIAEIFSVSQKTIESWMSNILKHLRTHFEQN